MKKAISFLMAAAMVLSLDACGSKEPGTSSSTPGSSSTPNTSASNPGGDTSSTVTFDHDITMIVPWSAGVGTDNVARKLVENAEKYLGV